MAKKILNRKELRAQNDEAEAAEAGEKGDKKAAKKTPTKRKSRAKTPKEVRLKAFWAVYNQSMKPVVKFEYNERKYADKKAAELSASGKSPHFVQLLKEVIEE
ncbi:MAG TPA: hypothetical protein VFE46_18375 [Pirellulales bacterium]|jgi:hypothetical protein|nr:hypothetical protein [Pirellulales bacterium]